jgi:hypothetical protein
MQKVEGSPISRFITNFLQMATLAIGEIREIESSRSCFAPILGTRAQNGPDLRRFGADFT